MVGVRSGEGAAFPTLPTFLMLTASDAVMRKTFKLISIFCLAVVAAVVVVKFDRFANAYYYVFYGGPYVNRAFQKSNHVVVRDDPLFQKLVYDRNFRDRRGHLPDFSLAFEKQVTVFATPTEKSAYLRFMDKYFRILKTAVNAPAAPKDALAFAIMGLSNEYFVQNQRSKKKDVNLGVFSNETSYRAEDFVFFLVNATAYCGMVGEATVALLRYVGFKTRLIRLSNSVEPVANHVFVEFYSNDQRRWVMLDPMINASPKAGGTSLSVFEILDRPDITAELNRRWGASNVYDFSVYGPRKVVFYDIRGPHMRLFYYTADPEIRSKLRTNLL